MIIKINPAKIFYKRKIQEFCRKKYYKHSNGCSNYGKKDGCPPNQPLIDKILDFRKDLFLIYTEFDVGSFARRMWGKHPGWSERQAYNCRLWQPTARKEQRIEERNAREKYNLTRIVSSPEAHGVNIDSLFKRIGIKMEWPPRKITRIVSFGGFSKKRNTD